MLKKSMKHEWKATWKRMAGINGAVLGLGLIGSLGVIGALNNVTIPDLLVGIYVFVYIIILIASSIVTYFMIASRYYKSIFTDEGYLTNTLPITSDQKILSRFLISLFWTIVNLLCVSGSILFLLIPLFSEGIRRNEESMYIFFSQIEDAFTTMAHELGFSSPALLCVFMTGVCLIGYIYFILSVYFSISMGSLFSSHRVLAAVLIYFGLSILMQALMTGMSLFDFILSSSFGSSFSLTLLFYSLIDLALAVVFYLVCRYIIDHRLNLQ